MDGWMDDSTIATVLLFNGGLMQVEFKVKAMYAIDLSYTIYPTAIGAAWHGMSWQCPDALGCDQEEEEEGATTPRWVNADTKYMCMYVCMYICMYRYVDDIHYLLHVVSLYLCIFVSFVS